jgi:hypothetical protein
MGIHRLGPDAIIEGLTVQSPGCPVPGGSPDRDEPGNESLASEKPILLGERNPKLGQDVSRPWDAIWVVC